MGRERSTGSTGARAVVALVVTAVLAFAVVGAAAYVAAHRIARADALSEALRTAHGVGGVVVEPELDAVLAGDRTARAVLDGAVASRREDGTLERIMVWRVIRHHPLVRRPRRWSVVRCRSTRGWRRCSPAGATTPTSRR